MSESKNISAMAGAPSRRQMAMGAMLALGSFADLSRSRAEAAQAAVKEPPATAANQARTSLHQEVEFSVGPERIYRALLDSKQFAAITGMPAEIDPAAGGAFSTFGGLIVGRNVELVASRRIVQAWRPTHWDAGIYSIVRFELNSHGPQTTVVLDHTGFPEGEFDHLDQGWPLRYWNPMKKFFA